MATRKGRVKRVILSDFASVRPSGLIAMGLAEGDSLGWVRLTQGDNEIVIVTENGQALRFSEIARSAHGTSSHRRYGDQAAR